MHLQPLNLAKCCCRRHCREKILHCIGCTSLSLSLALPPSLTYALNNGFVSPALNEEAGKYFVCQLMRVMIAIFVLWCGALNMCTVEDLPSEFEGIGQPLKPSYIPSNLGLSIFNR